MLSDVETYLRELRTIRASGAAVKETSYYAALATLLDAIGRQLKPRVRCVLQLQNQGAGFPDGGLFTSDQLRQASGDEPLYGQTPERGVIEVKPTSDDAWITAGGSQVTRYWGRYGQVLVTNYRDFVLVGRDTDGRPAKLETYRLATDEAAFSTDTPHRIAEAHGARLTEYLKRVLLHAAPLADPKDVAWFLASYARDALARVETADLPALAAVRAALEEALGLKFEGEKGEHFFRSSLIQTLFYGVFSAWVLWSKKHLPTERDARFSWREAQWSLQVPIIRALFEQVATPAKLGPLGLVETLDWTAAALNRVDRAAFFTTFEEGQAVQYFYEPFLQAFDPELRKQLGVWYTPTEIVRYMVARVDTALRQELDIADGLADPRVYVLDPCCGTGAFLVEVLRRIAGTLRERSADALIPHDLKRAALERVFGFEILPAPFVVAHMQLGLLLQSLGAPLAEAKSERASVYLTNALTGWEPPDPAKEKIVQLRLVGIPELQEERDAAEHVKRDVPILVILGNPPYNGYAGMAVDEERDLSTAYRTTKRAPAPQGQGLNDLYVRFFRMAERRIVEHTGKGAVCLISNYSWLDGLSFSGMRECYLEVFDRIWIDCLNGDKYRTGKLTPEGEPDPSIFSTEWNPEGIQVGTAVALLVRKGSHAGTDVVSFRHLWGKTKRDQLLETAAQDGEELYQKVEPPAGLGLPYLPAQADARYLAWPGLPDLFPVSFPGVKTSRDDFLVDIDRDRLVQRMTRFFDPAISHEEMRRIAPSAMADTARFPAAKIRDYLRSRGFLAESIIRYCYRPFDVRWLYWEPDTKLLDEKRAEYKPHVFDGNVWFTTTRRTRKGLFYQPQVTTVMADLNVIEANVQVVPLYRKANGGLLAGVGPNVAQPNLTDAAVRYLRQCDSAPAELFHHGLAILHAPRYALQNAGALRQDWPRIPLPQSRERLLASAALGRQVAALLDSENPVAGVTTGAIRAELQSVGVVSREGGGALDPDAGDLAVTAGWGHAGKDGVTMPGKGRVVARDYTAEQRAAVERGASALGLSPAVALAHLGETTCDVYLNDLAYWRNVPARVWAYTIGGYQVIKKWLSYRDQELLGRPLAADEAREVTNMARRIAALLLLEPELDENYRAVLTDVYPWTAGGPAPEAP